MRHSVCKLFTRVSLCSMMASPITGSRESEAFCNFDSLRKETLRLLKVGLIRLVSENKINGEREINGELA